MRNTDTTATPFIVERRLIDSLHPYPDNPRHGDVGAISESLRTLGQYVPITVNRREGVETTQTILRGNHTARAAAALGWTEIDVCYVDVDDDTARAIVLADNRTSDLATYDDDLLLNLLLTQRDASTLEGTGYDDDEIERLLRSTEAPLNFDDVPTPTDSTVTCPKCGYRIET